MNDQLKAFITRVESFEIDSDDKTLRFVDRLARENRWTVEYANRVIREYLRFCILAMRSGHPVTPSEDVDQAWHLHLTYTRSYWERFCGETLDGPLHHEPTAGGPDEGDKFRAWYGRTLDSYRNLFGSDPPQDIWPPPDKRFSHAGDLKWMNAGREWAVPKRLVAVGAGTIACGLAATLVRLSAESDVHFASVAAPITAAVLPFNLGGTDFLYFYAGLTLIGLVTVLALRVSASASEDQDPPTDDVGALSVDELAVLSGGGSRLAHVSLTRLFAEKRIEVVKTAWWSRSFRVAGPPPERPAIDRDLYLAIQGDKPSNRLMKYVKPHFERIEATLKEKGLRRKSARKSFAATWVMVFIGLIGGARLIQGLVLGEEIGYLAAMTVLFVIAATIMNLTWSQTTPKGRAYLERVKDTIEPDAIDQANPDPALLTMGVAVFGTSAIDGVEGFAPLTSLAPSVGRASSSGGCGAGCSGCGGGGCGGGGCGGCGG